MDANNVGQTEGPATPNVEAGSATLLPLYHASSSSLEVEERESDRGVMGFPGSRRALNGFGSAGLGYQQRLFGFAQNYYRGAAHAGSNAEAG